MADGSECLAIEEGTIYLGLSLVMKSVFYVEELKSDLISLGQLLDENRCVVQLADIFLVIQDRTTKTVTGVGKRDGGTFRFYGVETVAAVSTREKISYDLLHKRLGHPSAKVVSLLPDIEVSSSRDFLNKVCDTCLRTKQTRDCFPLSDSKSLDIFELIHFDVWGPYRTPSYSGARYFLTIVDDFSRGVWIALMIEKSETHIHLKNLMALVER